MNAVVRVTLSSATGPENRMVTRGLTLQPSNSLSNRISSQPAASAPQSGSGRAMRRPGAWPGSGTVSRSAGTSHPTWAAGAPPPRPPPPPPPPTHLTGPHALGLLEPELRGVLVGRLGAAHPEPAPLALALLGELRQERLRQVPRDREADGAIDRGHAVDPDPLAGHVHERPPRV